LKTNDYVAGICGQFENLDFAQQTAFNMAAVVLFDRAWARASNEFLGQDKAFQVTERAWNIIGEYTAELMQKALGLSAMSKFEHVRGVIKAGYRAWLIPIQINQENDDLFEFECLACPFPSYGIELFDVREGDHSCRVLKAMTPAWIDGIVNRAGLAGHFTAVIDSAICCGDVTCKVTVTKIGK